MLNQRGAQVKEIFVRQCRLYGGNEEISLFENRDFHDPPLGQKL